MKKRSIAIVGIFCILVGGVVYVWFGKRMSNKNEIKEQSVVSSIVQATPTNQATQNAMNIQKPSLQIDTKKEYTAILRTSVGDITIEFAASKTPLTVNNFVYLARQRFYDNTIFHRVMSGFMIQGGDPLGTGSGGPGYQFDDESFDDAYTRGTVAMANAGPNTNGSQFFIMHKDYDLPKNYVIFGHVTKGLDVVDSIATAPVTMKNGENSSPKNPVTIQTVEITEK